MAQAEMVTVRMSRGHMGTPWGFDIGPQLTIVNVIGGSLADRAGLLNGDILVELEGHQSLNVELAKQLLSKTEHRIELIVHRTGDSVSHRIWQPSVTENTEFNKFQHSVHSVTSSDIQNAQPPNVPLKVSLEHHSPGSIPIPGFNVTAQPFGDHQEVKHLQYNSPMPLYSPQSAAEQYLQQTGGLFGTDPNLTKQKEVPSYLRSETLRLIQESERSKEDGGGATAKTIAISRDETRSNVENVSGAPLCYICGRNIVGVMCRAYDRTMHGECFQCSTCGSSLKNQGHHFINDKFYCDVHGRQLRGGGGVSVGRRDEIHLSTTRRPQLAPSPNKDTLRAPYQPEVMARRPLSISPTPWKTQSPISPSNRGVPPAATHYGQELNELKREMFSSSIASGDSLGNQHHLYTLNRTHSLPVEIRKVTSPRRHPCKHRWPPESHEIRKYWQYGHLFTDVTGQSISNELNGTVFSLTKFIKENETEYRRPPSPKRYLLKSKQQRSSHKEIMNVKKNKNTNNVGQRYHSLPRNVDFREDRYNDYSGKQNSFPEEEQLERKEMYCTSKENCSEETCTKKLYSDYLTDDDEKFTSKRQEQEQNRQQKEDIPNRPNCLNITQNGINAKAEEQEWIEYEREKRDLNEEKTGVSKKESEDFKVMHSNNNSPHLILSYNEQLESSTAELPDIVSRFEEIGNADSDATKVDDDELVTETTGKFQTDYSENSSVENISYRDKISEEKLWGKNGEMSNDCKYMDKINFGSQKDKDEAEYERQTREKRKEFRNSKSLEEHDKRIAIESIARYQQELHEPEEELSQMLNNAIDFLKNLDNMDDKITVEKSHQLHQYRKVNDKSSKKMKSEDEEMKFTENLADIHQNLDNDQSCTEKSVRTVTPADLIIKVLHETASERRSNRNSYMKPSNPCEQQIRQGDELARGRGILQTQSSRIPYCEECKHEIRGAYVLANGLAYCPEHFVCANRSCGRKLLDIGFVEEKGRKYCERCFETQIAPRCAKCSHPITADCLNALQKQWHPHCFVCTHCHKPFGNSAFFLEQGQPYCESDWNTLFTTKCISCHYPIEAGDRWVEALGAAFHSNCFNCTSCNVNLEGESFYARNGAPYCKLHA